MPISKAAGWLTSDGQFFEKPEDCKDAEFLRAISEQCRDIFGLGVNYDAGEIITRLYNARMSLLATWKELNGGPVLTAPSRANDGESPP